MKLLNRLFNSKGNIYYGMHFYPGVAEYRDKDAGPYRVFLNENTIRQMDPTFAGRPVFVHHVDEVDGKVDELRKDADGWVIESFYNRADGKHWVKFIVVSEQGEKAIKRGFRLSNCYLPRGFGKGGQWNGVDYDKEVTGGEYEHLAIVPDPRYAESVIMTPEEFKAYNAEKETELNRLANKEDGLKLKFFKKAKVENSVDLEEMVVVLPKSGREVTITALVNEADEREQGKDKPRVANGSDRVKVGEEEMTVDELVKAHTEAVEEIANAKSCNTDDGKMDNEDDEKKENEEDEKKENEEDEEKEDKEEKEPKGKKEMNKGKKKNEADLTPDELAAKRKAKEKADALRNAQDRVTDEPARVDLTEDRVARGKSRYGS